METILDLIKEAGRRNLPLRVLVTRLRFLGDVIITTPVLKAIKDCLPETELYYMCEQKYAAVLEGNPHLDGIIGLEEGVMGTARAIRDIRRMNFVLALDLFYNPRSSNILFLSGIPLRIGGSRGIRKRLYTHNFKTPREISSCVRHHLYPLKILGCRPEGADLSPRVYIREEERMVGSRTLDMILGKRRKEKMIVAMHPGGTWQSKRWPARSFARLADMIMDSFRAEIVIVSGPGEREIAGEVSGSSGYSLKLLPPLPIRTLASVLYNCDAVIANDGGVMHLSIALQRPTVGIFGPTEPDIWFPYQSTGPYALATRNLECAPCHRHFCESLQCLEGLEEKEVFDKFMGVCGEANFG